VSAVSERVSLVVDPFPMVRIIDRVLPSGFHGPCFVWDVDKTYLETRLSQVRGLAQVPFEFGVDKVSVAGVPELLRGLRRGPRGELRPLQFVSASPPQISDSIQRKMLLDGVEWDALTWKDWGRLIFTGHALRLREQFGFKVSALLLLASDLPPGATLHLFGDDMEVDPQVFSLVAQVLDGSVRGGGLKERLLGSGVHASFVDGITILADTLPRRPVVDGVWIRLVKRPDGARIAGAGPLVNGWTSAGALARALESKGILDESQRSAVEAAAPGGALVAARN